MSPGQMDHRHRYKKTMRLCHRHRHISGDKLYFTRFRIHTLSMRHFQWASWFWIFIWISFLFDSSLENETKLSCSFLYTHTQPMTRVVAYLNQSALRKQRKGDFLVTSYIMHAILSTNWRS